MKPKNPDPAYPWKYPERYTRIKCKLCNKCWLDKRLGMCLYGGPFAGWADSFGNPIVEITNEFLG